MYVLSTSKSLKSHWSQHKLTKCEFLIFCVAVQRFKTNIIWSDAEKIRNVLHSISISKAEPNKINHENMNLEYDARPSPVTPTIYYPSSWPVQAPILRVLFCALTPACALRLLISHFSGQLWSLALPSKDLEMLVALNKNKLMEGNLKALNWGYVLEQLGMHTEWIVVNCK